MNWLRRNILLILDVVKFAGIVILLLMFINFNAKIVEQTKATQLIVKSQSQILDAIKQATLDNRITSEQKANLIICMLQVPVNERTTNTLEDCRRQTETSVATPVSPTPSSATTSTTPNPTPSAPQPTPAPPQRNPIVSPVIDVIKRVLKGVRL